MDRRKTIWSFFILLMGLAISFFVIRGHFSLEAAGLSIFLLIFIPTLLNPDLGLIIIIISMLLSPEVAAGSTTSRTVVIRIEDIFLLVVILAWLIRVAFTKDIASVFRTRLTAPFFLYITVCIVSTALAAIFKSTDLKVLDIKQSVFTIVKYAQYFLLFLIVKDNLKSLKQAKIFIAVFLIVASIVAIFSNVFIEREIESKQEFFRIGPPIAPRGAKEAGTLSGYLIFMMAIAGGLFITISSLPLRLLLLALVVLMFRGFLYTLSRGSYLAFIPMLVALVWFAKKNRLILIWALIASVFLGPIFMPQLVKERIITTFTTREELSGPRIEWESSPRARIESWKSIISEVFPRSPLFGVGVARGFVDGQIFLTLYETGLVGLILLVWILARLFKMVKKNLNLDALKEDNFALGITVGFMAGFVGLLVQALSANTFIIIKIMEPFWFMAAIVLKLPDLIRQRDEE